MPTTKLPLSRLIELLSKKYEQVIIISPDVLHDPLLKVSHGSDLITVLKTTLKQTNLTVQVYEDSLIIRPKPLIEKNKQKQLEPSRKKETKYLEEVVVLGSHLPQSNLMLSSPQNEIKHDFISVAGPLDGRELLSMLPQNGDIKFNENLTAGGVNLARGDLSSVNLRSLGSGNTLTLINGRRMAFHPGFQAEYGTPTMTTNMNSIPIHAVSNMQILSDSASAIYGADAVAGVLNINIKDQPEGVRYSALVSTAPEINKQEIDFYAEGARLFGSVDQGKVSAFFGYTERGAVPTSALKQSSSSYRTPLLEGTSFEGNLSFDNRARVGSFATFATLDGQPIKLSNGETLGDANGQFHLQLDSNPNCVLDSINSLCFDNGSISSQDRNLYYDTGANRQLYSQRKRLNLFITPRYWINDNTELYGEIAFYHAKSSRLSEAPRILNSALITIPKNNYWNPFGPKYLADGSLNPNRITNVDIPNEGLDLTLHGYRLVDVGQRHSLVNNTSFRFGAGIKGTTSGWNYDSALIYERVKSIDTTSNTVSSSLLSKALSLDTPDAYNPFNGGGYTTGSTYFEDFTPNDPNTIDSILTDIRKKGTTELLTLDARFTNAHLFEINSGLVGASAGIEIRYESFTDERSDNLNGTTPFYDPISGVTSISDALGNSATLDVFGNRFVASLFGEIQIPLIKTNTSRWLQRAKLQLASRYENFSDTQDILVPQLALHSQLNDSVSLRASWSKGFKVPNLVLLNSEQVPRQNYTVDYTNCAAQIAKNQIFDDLNDCPGVSIETLKEPGELNPERSTSFSFGLQLTPQLFDNLSINLDYWQIEQQHIIGSLGPSNQVALDLFQRQHGSTNPYVVRAEPTHEQELLYKGTGILPAGDILTVHDPYLNLQRRDAKGIDTLIKYKSWLSSGELELQMNLARLISLQQLPGKIASQLINQGIQGTSFGELAGRNGNPKWKMGVLAKWQTPNWLLGGSIEHTGRFIDTSVQNKGVDGEIQYWQVDAWSRVNLFTSYTFSKTYLDGLTISLGVKNIFNRLAPLADQQYGYFAAIHNPDGRTFSINFKYSL